MKPINLLAMSAFLIPVCAQAQTATEGLACFENLQMPEFPRAALQERVDGSVWTTTQVSSQGAIDKFDTQVVSAWKDGGKLLVPAVEKAVRAAKIKPACYGKTISAVFRYQLYGEAVPNPKVTSKTDGPTVMSIESQPLSVTQSAAAKPAH